MRGEIISMTLKELNDICKENNIPENVTLLSDSGWECSETQMDGIWYSKTDNSLVFTQDEDLLEYKVDNADWHYLTRGQKLVKIK
jgi:hypothetical protein